MISLLQLAIYPYGQVTIFTNKFSSDMSNNNLFLGVLIIFIGLAFLFFGLAIFKIIIALVIVVIGIKILKTGSLSAANSADTFFGEKEHVYSDLDNTEYNIAFGKATYDFTPYLLQEKNAKIKVNVAFGSVYVKLPKGTPYRIKASSALGQITLPEGSSPVFGTSYYKNDSFDLAQPYLKMELNVLFGTIIVVEE